MGFPRVLLIAGLVGLLGLPSGSALAVTAGELAAANAQARAAARDLAVINRDLLAAQRSYVAAITQVGVSVTDRILTDDASVQAERQAQQATDRSAATARALYRGGGSLGLIGSLLQADTLGDLGARVHGVDQVLQATQESAESAYRSSLAAADWAARSETAARASVITATEIQRRSAQIDLLLTQSQNRLNALSARARQLAQTRAAEATAARTAALVVRARASAPAGARAQIPPAGYFALYRAAAVTCPGMRWTLLAAVGQVESGHGRNVGPSSAGAIGPMQFMPRTFAAYGVDGNHDGVLDAFDPADAIYSAARYLCANGAGQPSTVRRALFAYNRANWYVDLVLGVEAKLIAA